MTINTNSPLRDNSFSNTETNFEIPRHRWYYYKEGFSPSLVNYAISTIPDFNKLTDYIFDPFNGSGTVTLFSGIHGYKAKGFEVNPFSSFVSKAKLTQLDDARIELFKSEVDNIVNLAKRGRPSPLENFSTFTENGSNSKWLFNRSVLNAFEAGKFYINSKSLRDLGIKRLIKLVLINSIMENCNAKKDGKCLRYKLNWSELNYTSESFISSFQAIAYNYLSDIKDCKIMAQPNIQTGDSRILITREKDKFKLCITSPPYLNSFDYTDIYRPELFLGDFIRLQNDLLKLRKKTLRSHINHVDKFNVSKTFGSLYDNTVGSLLINQNKLWSPKIPSMVQSYFEDMKLLLKNLRARADSSSHLWLVVGNSAYSNLEIPTDLILADIGGQVGWYLKEIGVLRYIHKRGSKYSPDISSLRESVIIFKSTSK